MWHSAGGSIFRQSGYRKPEFGSLSGLADHPYFAAHQCDQTLANRQTEAGSRIGSCHRLIHLPEPFENNLLIGLRDSFAGIFYIYQYFIVFALYR